VTWWVSATSSTLSSVSPLDFVELPNCVAKSLRSFSICNRSLVLGFARSPPIFGQATFARSREGCDSAARFPMLLTDGEPM
jgi:hypothetical protein